MEKETEQASLKLKTAFIGVILATWALFAACTQPMLYGRTEQVIAIRRSYNKTYDKVFEGARWAITKEGYAVQNESKPRGTLTTNWTPSTPDSHYVEVFGRRDYGTTGSYYHLDLAIYQEKGQIQVVVRSIAKSLVHRLHSTGITENKVLDNLERYLLGKDIEITNLGITKS